MEVSIVDAQGWSKNIVVERSLLRVGASPKNDIVLQGGGYPDHFFQIQADPSGRESSTLLSFSSQLSLLQAGLRTSPATATPIPIRSGDTVELPHHKLTIVFSQAQTSSGNIQVSITIPPADLKPGKGLEAVVRVKNLGVKSGCQFQVEVEGLPESCYQLEPIALLYAGAEEEIRLRLFHQGTEPLAGVVPLVISASSPESYPGEVATAQGLVRVAPVQDVLVELVGVDALPQEVE